MTHKRKGNAMTTKTMSMEKLKRSYEVVSVGNKAELRDAARNGLVVFAGTYAQVKREARKRGLTHEVEMEGYGTGVDCDGRTYGR